jgi:hypothetical protein
VQFVLKPTISSARQIKSLVFCEVRFLKRVNNFLRLVFVFGGGIRPSVRPGRGGENQAVAVPGYGKLQHATHVDPLNVHRRHVAQLIRLDTPRPRVMPRIQDPLDVLGHPRHDDVGQQRVVYLQRTDNCTAGNTGGIAPFHHREGGRYGRQPAMRRTSALWPAVAQPAPVLDVARVATRTVPDDAHARQAD